MLYYALPTLVLAMLGYMFWRASAHMRRDRVLIEREQTRGRHAFTPRHRVRFLLSRAFHVRQEEEPDWQATLKSRLDSVPAKPREPADV